MYIFHNLQSTNLCVQKQVAGSDRWKVLARLSWKVLVLFSLQICKTIQRNVSGMCLFLSCCQDPKERAGVSRCKLFSTFTCCNQDTKKREEGEAVFTFSANF